MVLLKPKDLRHRIPLLPKRNESLLSANDVKAAREYIDNYWQKLTRFHPEDNENLIGLPQPYLVPSYEPGREFDYNELYYWDSYFMVQGMLDDAHKDLVMGILEDLLVLFRRFRIIPNASRLYLTSRSQPPFLTSFIMDVHKAYNPDKEWLEAAVQTAKDEYLTVWMGTQKPNARQVYHGLSRYYDFNYLNDIAETESGWDYTTRFSHRCLNYLPVDLNSLLFKYESDFAYFARLFGDEEEAKEWDSRTTARRQTMNKLMWSDLRSFFYDYDFVKENRGSVNSLAPYYTMWAGVADDRQAAKLVKALRKFEKKGGVATTDGTQVSQLIPGSVPTQWAYPNGWAPLHFIVVKGLQRYGYHEDARRIALKWINTNLDWFKEHGVFLEKYNVVQPGRPPLKGVYPSQTGFGWTNAVFERFCREFVDRAG